MSGTVTLHHGDCLEVMRGMADASVDAVVTDPPAGIAFLNRSWDGDKGGRDRWVAWMQEVAAECLRVMKPGSYAVVWALPKTAHWTAWAWENAGFGVPREKTYFLFGTGFPKNHDFAGESDENGVRVVKPEFVGHPQAEGFGTALKPAAEEWLIFRKPLSEPTIAANVLKHGTGALAIDKCRVPTNESLNGGAYAKDGNDRDSYEGWRFKRTGDAGEYEQPAGRWPSNVLHSGDEEVLAAFARFGKRPGFSSGGRREGLGRDGSVFLGLKNGGAVTKHADTGTAARFFPALGYGEDELRFWYSGKASRKERDAGLEHSPSNPHDDRHFASPRLNDQRMEREQARNPVRNTHPTVKPIALMRWLCRLVTPPGGAILDPFAGSGSTGLAAMAEDFDCILVEREAEYVEIIKARLAHQETLAKPAPARKLVPLEQLLFRELLEDLA